MAAQLSDCVELSGNLPDYQCIRWPSWATPTKGWTRSALVMEVSGGSKGGGGSQVAGRGEGHQRRRRGNRNTYNVKCITTL